jgi:hypothetical protein
MSLATACDLGLLSQENRVVDANGRPSATEAFAALREAVGYTFDRPESMEILAALRGDPPGPRDIDAVLDRLDRCERRLAAVEAENLELRKRLEAHVHRH